MSNWVKNIITIESPNIELINQIKEFFGELDFNKIIPDAKTLNIEVGSYTDIAYKMYINHINSNVVYCIHDYEKNFFDKLPYIKDPNNPESKFGLCSEDISYLYTDPEDETDYKYKSPKNKGDLFMLGRLQYINMLKYGARHWYDFNSSIWGTKWSACYSWDEEKDNWYKEYKQDNIYIIRYEFRTAWGMPYGILNEFLFNFGYRKDLRLNIQYADEDIGRNIGWFLKDYNNMALNTYQLNIIPIKENIRFACMIWNEDYDEYMREISEE